MSPAPGQVWEGPCEPLDQFIVLRERGANGFEVAAGIDRLVVAHELFAHQDYRMTYDPMEKDEPHVWDYLRRAYGIVRPPAAERGRAGERQETEP